MWSTRITQTKKPARAMGILGPVIRAQVGERIRVVFKNKARFPFYTPMEFLSQKCEGANTTMEPMGQTKTTILSHPMIHILIYGMCQKMLGQDQMIWQQGVDVS